MKLQPRVRSLLIPPAILLAGVIASVLVAWALAAGTEVGWSKGTITRTFWVGESPGVYFSLQVYPSRRGEVVGLSQVPYPEGLVTLPDVTMADLPQAVPAWARERITQRLGRDDEQDDSLTLEARGFPAKCLYGEYGHPDGSHPGCILVGDSWHRHRIVNFDLPEKAILPFRPIWSGLAIDTAAYAALLTAVLFGPGLVRGFVRSRAGRCPTCGYDRRGLTPDAKCPECGTVPA